MDNQEFKLPWIVVVPPDLDHKAINLDFLQEVFPHRGILVIPATPEGAQLVTAMLREDPDA